VASKKRFKDIVIYIKKVKFSFVFVLFILLVFVWCNSIKNAGELESLCDKLIGYFTLKEALYDNSNWCLNLKKNEISKASKQEK
jgi:hypothetical protein